MQLHVKPKNELLDSRAAGRYVPHLMFEPIREQIETAARKTTHLRRFL